MGDLADLAELVAKDTEEPLADPVCLELLENLVEEPPEQGEKLELLDLQHPS